MFGFTITQLLVVAAYGYVMCCFLKPGETSKKMLLTGVLVLYLCMEGFEGFNYTDATADLKKDIQEFQDSSNIGTNQVTKGPADVRGGGLKGMSLNADSLNMSGYDGLCLKTGNQEYWMKSPDNTALVPNDTLYTYLGSEGPIKMRISDQSALKGPPIDGAKGSPEKMFMFANNVASPLCCPSTFSTSTGCICTTEAQRDYVAARGDNNDNYPTDSI